MNTYLRIPLVLGIWAAALSLAVAAVLTGGYFYVEPGLPEAHELREIKFQIRLGVYSRDGRLIEEFGEQKRSPVPYDEIPEILKRAFLAAEDDSFFNHAGVDYMGIARSAVRYISTGGERVPGASTITQQIAREHFKLTRGVSLVRKFKEWILAFRIEREFTKEEILGLYLNTSFFGYRSFGVAAAAQTYFNKTLAELTLSEAAIIAGIPQGPSILNPYYSPENARARRGYVLRRLRELGWITAEEYNQAAAEPIVSRQYAQQTELKADYVAELVRAEMIRRFGPAAYTDGLKVTTTIDSRLQNTANRSLQATLIDYDERHGYRGPLARVDLVTDSFVDPDSGRPDEDILRAYLADYADVLDFQTGLILSADELTAAVFVPRTGIEYVGLDAVAWAKPYHSDLQQGPAPERVSDVLSPGDVVRLRRVQDGRLRLAQLPDVQGAFVALDPRDGAIVSLVGGFDYFLSPYNRATQALRQPGSSFKPFIYSAAFENGYTAASIINDAPIVEHSDELETDWKPGNFEGRSHGEVRLREAFKRSMNQAAIRTLRDVGVGNTIRHLRRFGFESTALPTNLNLALGGGNISPLNLANAYAVFANGGHRVSSYLIQRIEDANGDVLYDAARSAAVACQPVEVEHEGARMEAGCPDGDEKEMASGRRGKRTPRLIERKTELYPELRRAPRVVEPQNVYLITDIMQDVIRSGSGARAGRALARSDIAGKTGTTNGPRDAWFAGFNADIVATAWVGFDDDTRNLGGDSEQGGVTAIPMWISFMAEALDGMPEHAMPRPPGIVDVRINPENGLVASDSNPRAVFEKFRVDQVPPREPDTLFVGPAAQGQPGQRASTEPIF